MDLWPNIWCNNSKSTLFLDGNLFVFYISFISPKNACFFCALYGNVTTFFSLVPKYTVQNPFQNKLVCPKLINVLIENNLSHRSGAKSTLCNAPIKLSLLSSNIFIRACPFCFTVTWCLSATSMCIHVSSNKPGIQPQTSGVIWHVAPEYKIQLVNY